MKGKTIGLILMFLGFVFVVCETYYFGNNWTPQSMAEAVCDLVSIVVVGVGAMMFVYCGKENA